MKKTFRVGLVSPYGHVAATGLRRVSACLKRAGWETRLILLPDRAELLYLPRPHPQDYPAGLLAQVCELCADLDLVGISVTTNFVGRARALTQAIHQRLAIPVIWGDIHATVRPRQCLAWADYACVGEGEEAMLDLVERLAAGGDGRDVPNVWARGAGGQVVANPPRPLEQNLDERPFPDYDLSTQYIWHQGRIVPLTGQLLSHYLINPLCGQPQVVYLTHTSLGCPYQCAYCCASAYARLYPDWGQVRRRSPENVAAEIEAVRQVIPSLQAIMFYDDTFTASSLEGLRRFGEVYRQRVGLPFFVQATPQSLSQEKLAYLLEIGLRDIEMGIQTGSPRTRQLFERSESDEHVIAAAQRLNRARQQLPLPTYDVISDNPYDTHGDRLRTLRLLQRLPRPFYVQAFSLVFYPGTELHRRARADGLIQNEREQIYAKNFYHPNPTYYNLVLLLMSRGLPRWLLGLMIQPLALRLFGSRPMQGPMRLIWRAVNQLRQRRATSRHQRQLAHLNLEKDAQAPAGHHE